MNMIKNILMFAWRDIKNPLAGGAEVVTDKYLSGLVKHGYKVTLFTSEFKGCKKNEVINGYNVIRDGGKLSVYLKAFFYYLKNKNNFDIIIDQVNTIPFFTPLYIPKSKRVAFFHQLALNVWFYEKPLIIALIGYLLENIYLKLYFNTRIFTVSNSTKLDLMKYALAKKNNILVLENKIDFKPVKNIFKNKLDFCFVGRLKRSKRVHDCIKALSLVNGDSKLFIIGDGDEYYKEKLKGLVNKLGLDKRVKFLGRVSSKKRNEVMKKSIAILVTSVREGWGLIVTEANANGTLAITYDIPGLRDANKKGIILKRNNYKSLAKVMNKLLLNKKLVLLKSRQSLLFANKYYGWEKNIERLIRWLKTH